MTQPKNVAAVPDLRRVPLGQLADRPDDALQRRILAGAERRVVVAAFNASL